MFGNMIKSYSLFSKYLINILLISATHRVHNFIFSFLNAYIKKIYDKFV
jgi:hypothetical protein